MPRKYREPRKAAAGQRLDRVAFTGDFLRFTARNGQYDSSQIRNVVWLKDVLTASGAWSGVRAEIVFPTKGLALDAKPAGIGKRALADYQTDADQAWAARYAAPSVDLFPAWIKQLLAVDLVIGFEMPPALKRHLHSSGQTYLSFHVHPLRLLQDLCFGVTTNDPRLARELEPLTLGHEAISHQVHHHRALCRFHNLPIFHLPPDLPIMIGQTARDSVLIDQGRFSTWADHAEAVAGHLRDHDAVVLLEHPYRPDSLDIAEHLRSDHGKTVLSINANGYALLLTSPNIPMVLTLSSSLAVEAEAMGHETRFLLGDPRQRLRVEGIDLGPEAPLAHGLLLKTFWQVVLNGQADAQDNVSSPGPEPFALGIDYLRSCLDAWSFQLIRAGLAGASNRTYFLPASALSAGRRQALLMSLGNRDPVPAPSGTPAWRQAGIELVELDLPLEPGDTRSINVGHSAARTYLASGFHPLEGWGCWSNQARAQLRIAVSEAAIDQQAWIFARLRLRAYEGLLDRCPVVRISLGSEALGYALFRPQRPDAQEVPVKFRATSRVVLLDVEISDVISPAAANFSHDERVFGFLLMNLELRCAAAGEAPTAEFAAGQISLSGLDAASITINPNYANRRGRP